VRADQRTSTQHRGFGQGVPALLGLRCAFPQIFVCLFVCLFVFTSRMSAALRLVFGLLGGDFEVFA